MGSGKEGLVLSGSGNSLQIKGFCSMENVSKFWAVQSLDTLSQMLLPSPTPTSTVTLCPQRPSPQSLPCQHRGQPRGGPCVLPTPTLQLLL